MFALTDRKSIQITMWYFFLLFHTRFLPLPYHQQQQQEQQFTLILFLLLRSVQLLIDDVSIKVWRKKLHFFMCTDYWTAKKKKRYLYILANFRSMFLIL